MGPVHRVVGQVETTHRPIFPRRAGGKSTPKTKQVTTSKASPTDQTDANADTADANADTADQDPRAYLLPDTEEGEVRLVQVPDKGSQPQSAPVIIGKVEAMGIVDTGADITIIGKRLFLTIAAARKLRKDDCRIADKTPRSYYRKPFSLHGMLQLDIQFEDRAMMTTVYVKMDACDELLLSEGVCRQLGILHTTHPYLPMGEQLFSQLQPMNNQRLSRRTLRPFQLSKLNY